MRDGEKADSQPAVSVYTLEYDAEGNAVKVTHGKPHAIASLGTSTEASYEYDKLNRLTRENNERLGRTWTYGYDAGGNITSKKEYAYSTTELDNAIPIETQDYVYNTSGWKDQLVSFGGEEITYDASGNPTGYRGATLAFEGGRRLKSYKKATDANAYEFTFDEDNLRLTKKHKEASGYDKTWTYWNTDGKLWGERITEKVQVGSFGILFWQDKVTEISYAHLSTGLAGFTVKEQVGTAAATTKSYLYRKNALGDIDAIYDTDMSLVGEYIYDAWGNCTIEATGTDNYAIMQLNPFRYRGYYWDKELNLYYLQTRYYDPETGRFINADGIEYALEQYKKINGLNLYSYCSNNPVMGVDPEGTINWKKVFNIVGAFFAITVATVIAVGSVVAGGFGGAVLGGAATGAAVAMAKNIKQQNFDNFNWKSFLGDAAVGAVVGAVTGAVSHVAMGIGASIGSQLGMSFSQHAIRGVTMGSIVPTDVLIGIGGFLGKTGASIAAQVASGFAVDYFLNENKDVENIMNNGILGAIGDLLTNLFN